MYRSLIKRITHFESRFHSDETDKTSNSFFFFFFASIQNIFIHIPLEKLLWGEIYIYLYIVKSQI